jgi:hypothetical protein
MSTTDIVRPSASRVVEESNESQRGGPALRRAQSIDYEISADDLDTLLRQALGTPTREIDNLISEFDALRKKLRTDANRIQREIAEYAELSQHVRQMTAIIHETVKKMSGDPNAGRY